MFKVYIVDDELVVRQGLKQIINWPELGFVICGEAGDGLTALEEIRELAPDLVLVDIRMPKLSGLDLVQRLRQEDYEGRVIVLSGYAEFEYAQEAIAYNVDYYLTKPIAQDQLGQAVQAIYAKLQENEQQTKHKSYYREKAKFRVLEEIIKRKNVNLPVIDSTLKELSLEAENYQVLIVEGVASPNDLYQAFCQELQISTNDADIEHYSDAGAEIILLKGKDMIGKFARQQRASAGKKNMPFVIMVGKVVSELVDVYASYEEALLVRNRKFFSRERKFILSKGDIAQLPETANTLPLEASSVIGSQLYSHIIVYKQHECESLLNRLFTSLVKTSSDLKTIKNFLAGILIYVIQEFKKDYSGYDIPFKTSAEIIKMVENATHLAEITDFILQESKRMIQSISDFSGDGILEAVLGFINHHYDQDLKLKTLAQKFGYNSSYLGQIFSQKYGVSFNDYLHKVRIEKAMELLLYGDYKIYEIANLVGYANVDYFHIKFREHAGTTPAKYRKRG